MCEGVIGCGEGGAPKSAGHGWGWMMTRVDDGLLEQGRRRGEDRGGESIRIVQASYAPGGRRMVLCV